MRAIWSKLKRVPGIQSLVYRWVKPHAYETAFAMLRAGNPHVMKVSEGLVVGVADLIANMGVKTVLNYPCAHFTGLDHRLMDDGVGCINADMVRGNGRVLNLLYNRVPRVELVVMRNFLDYIGTEDALLILSRLQQVGVGYLVSTDYPCLNGNWETYVGEWRPISLTMKPFEMGEPVKVIQDPDPERRPDRCVGVWCLR